MAAFQFGSLRAARADLGMGEMASEEECSEDKAYRGLGLTMPAREQVVIGWGAAISGGAGAAGCGVGSEVGGGLTPGDGAAGAGLFGGEVGAAG